MGWRRIIAQSEETGDTYFTAKAYIDLGLTYGLLGHYDKYREYIEKGLNTPIENELQAQFIKSYGAINLYTFSLKENDYEKVGKMFRYGGEEFVVLIEHQNRDVLMQLAEGIRSNVEGYEWSRRQVTVSIGVADGAPLRRDILNLADQNLYKAKSQGRNKVVYGE